MFEYLYKLMSEQGGERDARLEGPIDANLLNTALNNIPITGSTPAEVNSQYIHRLYCENNKFALKLRTLLANVNYRTLLWTGLTLCTSCYMTEAGVIYGGLYPRLKFRTVRRLLDYTNPYAA